MPSPRLTRPPDTTSSVAICFAMRTALCIGSTTTVSARRTRSVTAAAAAIVTMISGFGKVIRSPTARLVYGPASMRRAHSRMVARSSPGTITGKFIPSFIGRVPPIPQQRGSHCTVAAAAKALRPQPLTPDTHSHLSRCQAPHFTA